MIEFPDGLRQRFEYDQLGGIPFAELDHCRVVCDIERDAFGMAPVA